MRLAIPAWRRGYLRVMGGVIHEAITRGHKVHLLWRGGERKPGEYVSMAELVRAFPRAWVSRTPATADAVLGPLLHECDGLPAGPQFSVDYATDLVLAPPGAAMFCYVTERQRKLVGHPGVVIGSPHLDATMDVDPLAVRRRYHLDDRPVLLFMSLKFGVAHWQRNFVYRWLGYRRLLAALRREADARGWQLVVKTRVKNRDPKFLSRYAHAVIGDEALWPPATAELMRLAAWCVQFESGSVFEAAVAGVPSLTIRVPHPDIDALYPIKQRLREESPGAWDWPGVVAATSWTRPALRYEPIDANALAAYREQFTGPPNASQLLIDYVERWR